MSETIATAPAAPSASGDDRSKDLLRFITCGSVDDGKSTLIGRLLYDSQLILEDQMSALESASRRFGTTGEKVDLALLIDGLQAEREQGITIDVAYRFFATDRRKFIVADTPGHVQYTRNMATGASTAQIALVLVDARQGVLTQTRRHAYILSLMGLRRVVLVVNKMDLADWSQDRFDEIVGEFTGFAAGIGIDTVDAVPVSALTGDNITAPSERMPWFTGSPLLPYLEEVTVDEAAIDAPARFVVQWVNRPHLDLRGYSGMVHGGRIAVGDTLMTLPSGKQSTVTRIMTYGGDLEEAVAGQSVTLVLADQIDISRGDILANPDTAPPVADQFAAHLLWMDEARLLPGRSYAIQLGTALAGATVSRLKHAVDVNTMEHLAASHLDLNEIGVCNIALDRALPFDAYKDNRHTGGFILIDRLTNATVGAGMIDFPLRRASNLFWQPTTVKASSRANLKGQRPAVLWLTGLSGSGKSTIANAIEHRLFADGRHTFLLDGDNVRHGLNQDLGFTPEDRVENIRRVAEVARLMVDAGLIVIVSFISPFREERRMARRRIETADFIEIFVDTPLEICEQRDPKGLYKRARAGEIPGFTGIDSPYEPPEAPEIVLPTETLDPGGAADAVIDLLQERGLILRNE